MYTKPNCEQKIASFFKEKKIEYFLPIAEILSKWYDRNKRIKKPIFLRYIFVRIKNIKEYFLSLSTFYSKYYLRSGNIISVVSADAIESIKLAGAQRQSYEINTSFMRGQKVFVKGGVFNGLKGELVEVKGKSKVQVSIEVINKVILISISPEYLYKVDYKKNP